MYLLFIIIFYLSWIISFLGFGYLVLRILNISVKRIYLFLLSGFLGQMLVYILGQILNFFVPISDFISIIILITGGLLFLSFKLWRFIIKMSHIDKVALFLIFLSCFTYIFELCQNGDSLGYHIPSINWIKTIATPKGLGNLHGRLAFNSSWFIIGAICNIPLFITKYQHFILNSITLFFFLGTIILNTRSNSLSSAFLLLCLIPTIFKMHLIATPSPDDPVAIYFFIITYLLIISIETSNINTLFLALQISIFAATIKLSIASAVLGILAIIIVISKYKRNFKFSFSQTDFVTKIFRITIISLFILIPFVLRGYYLSGAPFYPLKIGFIEDLDWAVAKIQIIGEYEVIKGWARKPGLYAALAANNQVEWFLNWIENFIHKEVLWLAITIIASVLFITNQIKQKTLKYRNNILLPILFCCFGIIVWFIGAPDSRFGYAYLYSFTLIILGTSRNIKKKSEILIYKKKTKIAISIIIFLFCFALIYLNQEIINLNNIITGKKRLPITIVYWQNLLRSFGITILASLSVYYTHLIITKKRLSPTILIAIIIVLFNINKHAKTFNNKCKTPFYKTIMYKTNENKKIASLPGKIVDGFLIPNADSIKINNSNCAIPLTFTPYFYKSIKIKLNEEGIPFYFKHSTAFKEKDDFYELVWGVKSP